MVELGDVVEPLVDAVAEVADFALRRLRKGCAFVAAAMLVGLLVAYLWPS